MRRRLLPLILVVLAAVGGVIGTVIADNSPALGLDLQGGVAIVLEPDRDVDEGVLTQTIEILRSRVDALGVAEPEITRQGDQIVVQLPGVTDRARAREVVGQTAELRFRPVLQVLPPGDDLPAPAEETPAEEAGDELTDETTDEGAGTAGEGQPDDAEVVDPSTGATEEETARSFGAGQEAGQQRGQQEGEAGQEGTEAPTTTVAPQEQPTANLPLTPREEDLADRQVVLPQLEDGEEVLRYVLGPAELTGEVIARADARFENAWYVAVEFTGEGSPAWDEMAARYVGQQIAIVLDGNVVSAPSIETADFGGEAVITGDFSEREAKDLALVLRFGALPVELEELTVQEVSATLGRDALDAGVVAGIVGVALVAVFMIGYYRLLGVVAMLSMAVAGALLWTVIAYLGEAQGLALTLAGITGIIVSIGVAVDSNIVYYERVKEEVKGGKRPRVAVEQAFARSWSTILKADFASLIGAGLLYWLTVGPVRGFAFFLGLSTLLDLVASWFFMRPAAIALARSKRLGRPALLGLPRARPAATAAAPAGGGR